MNKEREIVKKPNGQKIILYPDGSWCNFNELIDTKWLFVFSSDVRLIDINSLEFKHENLFIVPSTVNDTFEGYFNWSKNWSLKNDFLHFTLKNNESEEFISCEGELVFAKSQRLIIGKASAKLKNKASMELENLFGKFTATEIE